MILLRHTEIHTDGVQASIDQVYSSIRWMCNRTLCKKRQWRNLIQSVRVHTTTMRTEMIEQGFIRPKPLMKLDRHQSSGLLWLGQGYLGCQFSMATVRRYAIDRPVCYTRRERGVGICASSPLVTPIALITVGNGDYVTKQHCCEFARADIAADSTRNPDLTEFLGLAYFFTFFSFFLVGWINHNSDDWIFFF